LSNIHIRQVWEAEDGLSPAQTLVLVRLADRADSAGVCFPGVISLCKDTKLGERTVREALGILRQRGLLKIVRRSTFSQPPMYRVFPRLPISPDSGVQNPQGVQDLPDLRDMQVVQNPQVLRQRVQYPLGGVQNPQGGGAESAETGVQNLHPNPQKRTPSESPLGAAPPAEPARPTGEPADFGVGVSVPSDEEVHAFGRVFPGDLARGVPPKIPEVWTASWLAWRKDESRAPWPADWKAALARKFVQDWLAKHPKALGVEANGVRETVWAVKTRLEECRKKLLEHPANRGGAAFDADLAKDPDLKQEAANLRAEVEALELKIRKG